MIKINLNPVFSNDTLTASLSNTTLTVNGIDYDLSLLEDGATAQHLVLGTVTRNGNDYELTLTLPHPPVQWTQLNETTLVRSTHEQRFPEPIIVTNDGEIAFPQPETKEVSNELAE